MKSFGFRCGYMAGNRSRFSKYYMTGSPVFSINFINRLIPAKLKYLMSIENSQAILKYFIDLKSETSVNQTRLEIYKAFQDRLTIPNRLIAEFPFRKVQISISQTTDSHFANYRFPFPFRFVPFRFANYSKPSRSR